MRDNFPSKQKANVLVRDVRCGGRWWGGGGGAGAHLTADHDVGDFGLAVTAVCLVVSGADRQHEVAGVALALPHQEAAVLALLRQQLLSLPARQVSVEPSGEKHGR